MEPPPKRVKAEGEEGVVGAQGTHAAACSCISAAGLPTRCVLCTHHPPMPLFAVAGRRWTCLCVPYVNHPRALVCLCVCVIVGAPGLAHGGHTPTAGPCVLAARPLAAMVLVEWPAALSWPRSGSVGGCVAASYGEGVQSTTHMFAPQIFTDGAAADTGFDARQKNSMLSVMRMLFGCFLLAGTLNSAHAGSQDSAQ